MNITEHLAKHEHTLRGVAAHVATRYRLSRDMQDDLYQEGAMVLAQAHADGYDHERAELITFAYERARWAMIDYARSQVGSPAQAGDLHDLADMVDEQGATFRDRTTTGVILLGPGSDMDEQADTQAA